MLAFALPNRETEQEKRERKKGEKMQMTKKVVSVIMLTVILVNVIDFAVIRSAVYATKLEQGATDSWPMFRNDETHTAYSTSSVGVDLGEVWNLSTWGKIRSSPAVVNDTVFVGCLGGFVYAWNPSQSSPDWIHLLPNATYSSPAIVENVLYIGSDDGYVYALNVTDGGSQVGAPYRTGKAVRSSPIVVDDVLYVGSSDGYVYAWNTTTQAELWRFWTASSVESSPAFYDDTVFFGAMDGRVYALDKTGKYKWHNDTNGPVVSSPAVANGGVFVGSNDSYVYGFNATDGSHLWPPFPTDGNVTSSPAVSCDRVFVGSDNGTVYAINATTGGHIWHYATGKSIHSSPAVTADGKVFIGSTDTYIYSLDAANGSFIWKYNTGDAIFSSPAIVKGKVFIGSDDRNIHVYVSNHPPIARISVSPSESIVTQRVKFNGLQSSEPDNATGDRIDAYLWEFGDGTGGTGISIIHTYFRPGTYEVTLTVNDTFGARGKDSLNFTVYEAWPMFRHDQNHTGYTTSLAPVRNDLAWPAIKVGPDVSGATRIYPSPATVGDKVFMFSTNKTVYAIFASNGTLNWTTVLDTTPMVDADASPAYSEGAIYIGCDNGNISALSTVDGHFIWNNTVATGYEISSPTVDLDMVFVGCFDRHVYSFDKNVGSDKKSSALLDGEVYSTPAVANGFVYVATMNGSVYALNETTLSTKWRYQIGVEIVSSPTVVGDTVFVGSRNNRLYALKAVTSNSNGEKKWDFPTGGDVDSSPAYADGIVFVGSKDGKLYAINATNGQHLWNVSIGSMGWSSPAISGGKVYVGSQNRRIYALNIGGNGSEMWSYETNGPVESSPAILDDTLYVGSQDGYLYAFRSDIHDVAVTDVVPAAKEVKQGQSVNISVTLKNEGTYNETNVNVTAYFNDSVIGTRLVNVLREQTLNLDFEWNTNATGTPVPEGNYIISANATLSDAEDGDPGDNNKVDDIVLVTLRVHDVAVINVTTSKSDCRPEPLVGQNMTVKIFVSVENQGNFPEAFNITIYATNSSGTYYITQIPVALDQNSSTVSEYDWNTSAFAICHYTLNATADTVEFETDIADNTFAGEPLLVSLIGDVNVDYYVGIDDIFDIASHFGRAPSSPDWLPECPNRDIIKDDLFIGIDDIFEAAIHFGNELPPYPSFF
jgi:outer membrane protein assembly factor BamB